MDPDELFDQLQVEQAPRMRQSRRLVLDEVQVSPGESRMGDGARVELGPEVDADAPLEAAPKAPPSGPPVTDDGMRRAAAVEERNARVQAAEDAASVSPWWDAVQLVNPLAGDEGMAAGRRTRERASQWWDQFTSGDERLGGRNPIEPIVGEDRRAEAPLRGFRDVAMPLFDEMRAAAASQAVPRAPEAALSTYRRVRDEERDAQRTAREQAPHTYATGATFGAGAAMATPAALGGVRGAALSGAAGGFAASEGDVLESPGQVAVDTGIGGAAGTVLGGGAALLGRAQRALRPEAWDEAAEATLRGSDQARLEASGLWGRAALEEADSLPGGIPAVADDFRRLRLGQGGGSIPRMDRAAADAATLGERAIERAGDVSRDLTARGVDVPASRILSRADELAAGSRSQPSALAQRAAERIEGEVAPMRGRDGIPFEDAWRLRRSYDRRASFGPTRPPPDEVAGEAGGMFRQLRDVTADELEDAALRGERGADWMSAMRESSLSRLMEQHGRGAQRLSTQGGMGGATATGDIMADAVNSGSLWQMATAVPRSIAARWLSQEQRMLAPGVRAVMGERAAAGMRGVSRRLYALAQQGALPPDTPGARQLVEAAARGETAFATTLHVLAQRDAELREAMAEFEALQAEQQEQAQ